MESHLELHSVYELVFVMVYAWVSDSVFRMESRMVLQTALQMASG
jgi:hypothetical protein